MFNLLISISFIASSDTMENINIVFVNIFHGRENLN